MKRHTLLCMLCSSVLSACISPAPNASKATDSASIQVLDIGVPYRGGVCAASSFSHTEANSNVVTLPVAPALLPSQAIVIEENSLPNRQVIYDPPIAEEVLLGVLPITSVSPTSPEPSNSALKGNAPTPP